MILSNRDIKNSLLKCEKIKWVLGALADPVLKDTISQGMIEEALTAVLELGRLFVSGDEQQIIEPWMPISKLKDMEKEVCMFVPATNESKPLILFVSMGYCKAWDFQPTHWFEVLPPKEGGEK